MKDYAYQVSGWLASSGNSLVDNLRSGIPLCRVVVVEPENYRAGYVSTVGGSFKPPRQSGNWYGTSFDVAIVEARPTGTPIYELSRLNQDTPVWNLYKPPEPFLAAIRADRNLDSGQFLKSQFLVERVRASTVASSASGVYFPSRQTDGGVVILNPHTVSIEIVFTGQFLPPGLA